MHMHPVLELRNACCMLGLQLFAIHVSTFSMLLTYATELSFHKMILMSCVSNARAHTYTFVRDKFHCNAQWKVNNWRNKNKKNKRKEEKS